MKYPYSYHNKRLSADIEGEKNKKAYELADDCGYCRTGCAQSKGKNENGSRMIFNMPPADKPTMENVAFPSARRALFITYEQHINGAPMKIYCP